MACALVLAAVAAVATSLLLQPQPRRAPPTTFVAGALGAASPGASLQRRLASGATLAIDASGLDAHLGSATIALSSRGIRHGRWQRRTGGATRTTRFGHESILFGINRAEQFLTVARRQGARTWSWQIDATHGTAHLASDGSIEFARHGRLIGYRILPVAILDTRGRDVTPAGARWSLARHGAGWRLGLHLDDRALPVPYLIDPIALIAACGLAAGPGGTTSCTAASSTGASSLALTKPSAAVAGDALVAQVTVRSTGAITAPGGWNQIGTTVQDATSPLEQAVFWHRVDGTEPASLTFSWAGGNADASGGLVTYKGVDPFVGFDQGASATIAANSAGAAATGNAAGLAVTTSAANEMLQAAYGMANGVTLTQSGAQGLVREWTVSSTGGTKTTSGFSDGVQAAAGASGNKTATWVTSSLWVAQLFALKNEAADGTGTVAASTTAVSSSQPGVTETLTYTPAAGSMANGDVSFVVPVGWSAPQTATPSAAGYVTAGGGIGANTIAVTGTGPWTVTVSGVTLDQGSAQTLVMKYGDTSGGGPGVTATATTGGVVWTTKQRSSSRGVLTSLGVSPTVTVYAADGAGTVASSLSAVSGSQAALTETLTYTAPTGGLLNGTLTVVVPAGWTPPATVAGAGFTTSSVGAVSVSGQTITVTGVTRTAAQTVVIAYGSGATATAAAGPGAQTWQVSEASTAGGSLTAIGVSPATTLYAPDASGSVTTPATNVSASQTGNTVTFTYTVGAGDMSAGGIKLTIPAGWTAPSIAAANAGYTTSSVGTVAVAAQVVTISNITATAGSTLTITYGSRAGGGAGATATATTGAGTWQVQQRSTAGGVFTNLAAGSPSITINAANGSGTMTASIAVVSASQTGRTITFTYTAAAGGMANGSVTVAAPAGWTAPSTTPAAAGYTSASTGVVSVAGQIITVSGVTLAGAATMSIVYGDTSGGGAGSAASSATGAQTWQGRQMSTTGGVLANLAASPSITQYAGDGAGTATASVSVVSASQTGRTVTVTYTAATGGMLTGALTLVVPAGWTAPATVAGPGYTTSSVGVVSVSGQTVTITGVSRTAAQTVVITYGSGGTATAPAATGAQSWQLQESSTTAGVLTSLAASPTITVYAADGSGTLTTPTTNVSASQTGQTLVFTYTAAAGGTNGGSMTLVVPAGWSAPSTVANANGYTTATAGTVTTAAQTITLSNLTLAGGATTTITYGSTAGGGVGATAAAATGAQVWQGKERSTAAGVLTNPAATPSITVNAGNGSGTLTVLPVNVGNGSAGNTQTFTYTAAAGGMASGDVTITAPAGWSAPSTTSSAAGYTTASTGVVSVTGQTVTVSGVTLAAAGTMTVVYGSVAGGGPGATASTTAGANAFATQQRSTAGGILTNIAGSPSVNVYSADGSGTATTPTANVVNGSSNTIVFTYKAAALGGISGGAVTLTAPVGWPAPTAGNTTSSTGARSYAGQTVTVTGLTLAPNATFTITYGPAVAPVTGGAQTWSLTERSTAGGALTALAASPSVNIYAPDGSGTLSGATSPVGFGSPANTESLTYTAAAGGTSNGSLTVVVPAGWSAPSTVPGNAGYTTSSSGTVSVAAQTITVSSITLAAGATLTLTYGSGAPAASAPSVAGSATWQAKLKASVGGVLTNLGASPSITVAASPTSAPTLPAAAALYGIASWAAGCASAGFCGTGIDNSGTGLQKVELAIRRGVGNYWDGFGFSSASPVFVPATGTGTWSYAFPITSFPADGSYTVQVRATDNLNGVEVPSSRTFTIDATPPTAFTLASPVAGFVGPGSIASATASDGGGSGITQVEFRYCPGTSCPFASGTPVGAPVVTTGFASQGWDLSTLTDGAQYTAVARASDAAGNTTDSATTTITLDRTAPTTTDDAPAGTQSSPVTVDLTAGDGLGSGVSLTHYRLDGGTWQTGASVPISAPSDHTNDGTHTIDYYSVDNVANTEPTHQATVTIDTSPPTGSPADPGLILSGTVTLSDPSPSDSGAGLASVAFAYSVHGANSWTTIGTATSAPWSTQFDTTAVADGDYDLRELISDAAVPSNTVTIDLPGLYAIDNHPPTVTLGGVGSAINGTIALTTTTSADTTQVRFERSPAGGGTWTTISIDNSAPFSANLNSTLLADGPYDLRAVATDGHTSVASNVDATRVDNTAPTGSVTTPTAGATVGGPSVTLSTDAGDAGSGVATVRFRIDGATVATVGAPPWSTAWDASSTPSGAHTLDAVITDAAGNVITTPAVPVTVDSDPPTVTLTDPGALLSGSVTLQAASPDADSARVVFQARLGTGPWSPVAVDSTPPTPYVGAFDSNMLADGLYDVRAIAYDNVGNASAPSVVVGRRIDNTAPSFVSANPADGSTIVGASSVAVTASEDLSAVTGTKLDGNAIGAPSISGGVTTFATGALADGPHTLAGTLVDLVGKARFFTTHVTVVSGPAPVNWPFVEMNVSPSGSTTLTSPDGGATVTMAAGTYSSSTDHFVLRIDPDPAVQLDGGFSTSALGYGITCYWALNGVQVHSFMSPLEIVLSNTTGDPGVLPATFENGAWRPIDVVPTAGVLPPGRSDGYYVGPGGIHILSRHLSQFTLLHDRFPPAPPSGFEGLVGDDGLTLRWVPGLDQGAPPAHVNLYVDGARSAAFDPTQFEAKLGPIAAGDPRTFSLTDSDLAGNESSPTTRLRALPQVAGLSVQEALAALQIAGFVPRVVAQRASDAPLDTVLTPADVELRPVGSTVDLTISAGTERAALASFAFSAVTPAPFQPARYRAIRTSARSTREGIVTIALLAPGGRRLASWERPLRAGVNHSQLRLPTAIRAALLEAPGRYWLTWVARSGNERAVERKAMRVLAAPGVRARRR